MSTVYACNHGLESTLPFVHHLGPTTTTGAYYQNLGITGIETNP